MATAALSRSNVYLKLRDLSELYSRIRILRLYFRAEGNQRLHRGGWPTSLSCSLPIARTHHREGRIQEEKEAAVRFTRVPAKETPRQRAPRAAPKHQTALTGNVPTGPVAVACKKSTESEANLPAIASSASALGQAIARELATLHG